MNVDVQTYQSWRKRVAEELPKARVDCPDCEGEGNAVCPHCGSEDGDCERCDGTGKIYAVDLLTVNLFRECLAYEESMCDDWLRGVPVRIASKNPLALLINDLEPAKHATAVTISFRNDAIQLVCLSVEC